MVSSITALIASIVISMLLLLNAESPSPTPSPPSVPRCTDELISFSPCLFYVSSSPNNLSDTASDNCCKVFSAAFNSGAAVCYCYLLREPQILGFPINSTRLLSLSSDCALTSGASAEAPSLNLLCSGSPILPHLDSATAVGNLSNSASSGSGTSSMRMPPIDRGRLPRTSSPKSGKRSPDAATGKGGGSSGRPGNGMTYLSPIHRPYPDSSELCSRWSWLLGGILAVLVPLLTTL